MVGVKNAMRDLLLGTALLLSLSSGCAKGGAAAPAPGDGAGPVPPDGCGDQCDSDGDGVHDGVDTCANTPTGAPVNHAGCADGQLMPKLEPVFPPFQLVWTPTGNPGRAGGLTWTYTGIQRADLFHIWWLMCDEPMPACGLSLDGPIDQAAEKWQNAPAQSDLPNGKLVFTNATHITLADGTIAAIAGRLTVTIVDGTNAAIPIASTSALGVTARSAVFGAEIKTSGFKAVALAEVQDPTTMAYSPALDYYDAAATPDTGDAGGNATLSFDGAFYDK